MNDLPDDELRTVMSEHGVPNVENKSRSELWQTLLYDAQNSTEIDFLSRFHANAMHRLYDTLKLSHDALDPDIDTLLTSFATLPERHKKSRKDGNIKKNRKYRRMTHKCDDK